ncbi:MAG: hypothetical protein ACYDB7_14495, partial [Mycobacteriales bacterium]
MTSSGIPPRPPTADTITLAPSPATSTPGVGLAGAAGGAGKDWEQSACGALPFRSACGALEAADAGRPVRPA